MTKEKWIQVLKYVLTAILAALGGATAMNCATPGDLSGRLGGEIVYEETTTEIEDLEQLEEEKEDANRPD